MYRSKRRGRLVLVVFLALSILIITLDFRGGPGGPLERAQEITQAIVAPIQRGVAAVTRPIGNFFSAIGDLANLREDNNRLEARVEEMTQEIVEAQELKDENAELREILGLDTPWYNMESVTAQVISEAPSNWKWSVVINRGSNDGIEKDMAVITPQGLVGKILPNVQPNTAEVLLLIDPSLGVGATTDERRLLGVVLGRGEGEDFAMNFVSKDESIRVSDQVVTSNRNQGIFPPSIPIGYVSSVGGDARDPNFDIRVNPYVDFQHLNFLTVLLETGDRVTEDENG
jgi:rod shape-determining protein MreC